MPDPMKSWAVLQSKLYPRMSHSCKKWLESPGSGKKDYPRLIRTGCVMFLLLFATKYSLSRSGLLLALSINTEGLGYGMGLMNLQNILLLVAAK